MAPPYVRKLYGEPPKTSELQIGRRWFARGRDLAGVDCKFEDIEHQIPEIARELSLLEDVVALRLRAAEMTSGEQLANKLDLNTNPVKIEAATIIHYDDRTPVPYQRPDPVTLTEIAYHLNFDPTLVLPFSAFQRPHFAAAAAAGQFERTSRFDEEPTAKWGLRGLLDEKADDDLDAGLAAARKILRPRVPASLRKAVEKEPWPVLAPLEIVQVRSFLSDEERKRAERERSALPTT